MRKKLVMGMVCVAMLTLVGCKGKTEVVQKEIVVDDGAGDLISDTVLDSELNYVESTDVLLTTEQTTYNKGTKEIVIKIENTTDSQFSYGALYTIEKKIDGAWVEVEPVDPVMSVMMMYYVEANSVVTTPINITFYGDLSDGTYRIVKIFSNATLNDEIAHKSYAEFTVASAVTAASRLAALYLTLDKDTYTSEDTVLNYTIGNNTGATKTAVVRSHLEKEINGSWEVTDTIFNTYSTLLGDKTELTLDFSEYPELSEGVYLLTVGIQEEDGAAETVVSATFNYK